MRYLTRSCSGATENWVENSYALVLTRTVQTRIAAGFDCFARMLQDAGFRYTVYFENRKPVFDKL